MEYSSEPLMRKNNNKNNMKNQEIIDDVGAAAYEIMRSLGLGITNDNLNKIPQGSL